ncbi:tryptophan synthase subunit alpha [Candidatus Vidania fulgoroideorum]
MIIPFIIPLFPSRYLFLKIINYLKNDFKNIELGIPCNNPYMDGDVIKKIYINILKKYSLPELIFTIVKLFYNCNFKIIIVIYYDSVIELGKKFFYNFVKFLRIKKIIFVDLPVIYLKKKINLLKKYKINLICLIPINLKIKKILNNIKIFKKIKIYNIYFCGSNFTGKSNKNIVKSCKKLMKIKKKFKKINYIYGFGVKKKKEVVLLKKFFKNIVIGSKILEFFLINKKNSFLKFKNYLKKCLK